MPSRTPSPRPPLALLLLLLVLLNLFSGSSAQDPCSLPAKALGGFAWYGTPQELASCYQSLAVPSEAIRTGTIDAILNALEFYSFTDIAVDSGPPYNIQVDLVAEVEALRSQTFANDWDFHKSISDIYKKASDFHNFYQLPFTYTQQMIVLPFSLRSRVVSGQQELYLAEGFLGEDYAGGVGTVPVAPSTLYAKKLEKINGVDAMTFLKTYSQSLGLVKDDGARFNALVGATFRDLNLFAKQPMSFGLAIVESYTWTVEGSDYVFPNLAVSYQTVASSANFLSGNYPTKKRSEVAEQDVYGRHLIQARLDYLKEEQAKKRGTFSLNYDDFENEDLKIVRQSETVNGEFACWNLRDGQAMVMHIKNFVPVLQGQFAADRNGAVLTLRNCLNEAGLQNIDNLILDLRSNPGGETWLSLQLMATLIKAWTDDSDVAGTYNHESNMYGIFDIRKGPLTDTLEAADFFTLNKPLFLDRVTGSILTDNSFYTNSISRSRTASSTTSAEFSSPTLYNWNNDDNFIPNDSRKDGLPYYFDKIIVLTDGLCASACAQVLHLLRSNDKVRVITVGGIVGEPLATISYPGGSVESWPNWVAKANAASPDLLSPLPSSSYFTFNWMEMYTSCSVATDPLEKPLEFVRTEGDARIDSWDILYEDMWAGTPEGVANSVAVYDQVLPYFGRMPVSFPRKSGVPRTAGNPLPDFCSVITPFTPPSMNAPGFSADCVAEWVLGDRCVPLEGQCLEGIRTDTYMLYIPGDGVPCEETHLTTREVSCVPGEDECDNCYGEFEQVGSCVDSLALYRYNVLHEGVVPPGIKCEFVTGEEAILPCTPPICPGDDDCPDPRCPGPECPIGQVSTRAVVTPSMTCVDNTVINAKVAYFGYANQDSVELDIPISAGEKNYFDPQTDRGQPTAFLSGTHHFAIRIPLSNSDVSLSLINYVIDGNVLFNPQLVDAGLGCASSYVITLTGIPTNVSVSDSAGILGCITSHCGLDAASVVVETEGSDTRFSFRVNTGSTITAPRAAYQVSEKERTLPTYLEECTGQIGWSTARLSWASVVPVLTGIPPPYETVNVTYPVSAPPSQGLSGGVIAVIIIVPIVVILLVVAGVFFVRRRREHDVTTMKGHYTGDYSATPLMENPDAPPSIASLHQAKHTVSPVAASTSTYQPPSVATSPSPATPAAPENVIEKFARENGISVGTKLTAMWSEDQQWYSARVDKISPEGFEVTFIEYGNTEVIPSSSIDASSITG
eukprot:TRINITY_DN2486_c3_g2_i3.p1 TRINITY_DN2486_c3_g2~~TRINITY_DN2486_c3_g2_i3.p1  ORF type:complete len:1242 (-),score=226.99 TRINITY_DN2486_c3_g2_i3:646-4371(-)